MEERHFLASFPTFYTRPNNAQQMKFPMVVFPFLPVLLSLQQLSLRPCFRLFLTPGPSIGLRNMHKENNRKEEQLHYSRNVLCLLNSRLIKKAWTSVAYLYDSSSMLSAERNLYWSFYSCRLNPYAISLLLSFLLASACWFMFISCGTTLIFCSHQFC